jgi:hypothetical protein
MLRGKCYCSGCLGLALGCCVAAVAMALLIFVEWPPESLGLPILLLGLAFVCLSLAETAVHLRLKAFHVLANIMLVIGFLAAVVGVAVGTQNGGYGLIAILLCLLWMDTRVQISNWKHAHVCHKCPQDCKSY